MPRGALPRPRKASEVRKKASQMGFLRRTSVKESEKIEELFAVVVCWLLSVQTACFCISGTDLLRRL